MFAWKLTSKQKLFLWLLQFLIIISVLAYQQINQPLKLNADLLSLFDSQSVSPFDNITKKIESRNLNRQIILVGADTLKKAIKQAESLTKQLNNSPFISSAIFQFPSSPSIENIIENYQLYHHNFISDDFREILVKGDRDEIFSYQFSLLNQIANPAVSLTLKNDPTLSLADFISQTSISNNGLTMQDNHLVVQYQQQYYVLVTFTPDDSALNIDSTQKLVSSIKDFTQNNAIETLYTGNIFYTSEASKTGQKEMFLYGGISIFATLILIILAYRSFAALIATATLIVISFIYGYLALSSIYTELNIIALVFSVTLIGIAADYSFHALTELKYSSAGAGLKPIHSSLIMSYLTTGAGYSLLLLAPFTLFQQIALFTLFGLLGTLITVLLCYPFLETLIGKKLSINTLSSINKIHDTQKKIIDITTRYWQVILILFVLSIVTLLINHNKEDVKNYYTPEQKLKQMEIKIKTILGVSWENQYFLVEGVNEQDLLQNEEQLTEKLKRLVKSEKLGEFSAITTWLPSFNSQKFNRLLIKKAHNAGDFSRIKSILKTANWNWTSAEHLLTPNQWLKTPIGKLFQQQWIYNDDGYYSVVRLAGIKSLSELNQLSKSLKKSHLIDKARKISAQMEQFKIHLILILISAFFAALLVFAWRYGIKTASIGLLTPLLSLIFALMLSFVLQQQLNIFNFIAGILILALGLDYSVFYSEHGFAKKITLTTLMSALSSTFVFAILMFSSMPAIRSFGLTVFIGISLTFLFSPLVTMAKNRL